MPRSLIEEYWTGVVARLQSEVQVFNELIGHSGEKGRENEEALGRVLSNLLPPTVGVGTGVIFDHVGNRSKQTDIIVFDKSAQPQLLAQTSQMLFPIEIVYCTIEIKTTLDNAAIVDYESKAKAQRGLVPIAGYGMPASALFAYTCETPFTQAGLLAGLKDDSRPDAFCVIDPGIVGRPYGDPSIGYVTLLDNGRPLVPPMESAEQHLHHGSPYPVFTTRRYAQGDRFCGDPARALLLFCADLLHLLSPQVRGDWLSHYMSEESNHLEPLAT